MKVYGWEFKNEYCVDFNYCISSNNLRDTTNLEHSVSVNTNSQGILSDLEQIWE